MARPIKKGLMFFYNDVNFYQDIRIRKLIHRKGGQAATVYHILLCEIYRQGYYLPWDDDIPFLVMEVSGFEEVYISDVIKYCMEVGLFNKQLFEEEKVLTSSGIQHRYFAAGKDAKRKVGNDLPYLLITVEREIQKVHVDNEPTLDFKEETCISSEETIVNSEETIVNPEETLINSENSTQRKEKKSKDNNSLRSSLLPSTTTSPACEDFVEEGKDNDDPLTAGQAVESLKKDNDWLLQMQRKFGMTPEELLRWFDCFVVDCDCRGKQQHDSLSDVKQHFNDWLSKMKSTESGGKKSGKQAAKKDTPQQRWNRCQAELCYSVGDEIARKSFGVVSFEKFDATDCALYIRVPSKETYEYIEQNLVKTLNNILPKYFGNRVSLKYHLPEHQPYGYKTAEKQESLL